jgi:hypothetical protein
VVSSDTAAFSEEVIKGLADQGARDLLMHHFPYIRSLLNLSGTSNLRTIRYFLMEVASLISDIRPVEGSAVRPLLSAICKSERRRARHCCGRLPHGWNGSSNSNPRESRQPLSGR